MDKKRIRQQIDSILSGIDEKQGVMVVTDHDCPPNCYRYGEHSEMIITAEELELLRSKYTMLVVFTSKKSKP